ncbi:MAG: SET domain-containing protein-lysine N-methyltransferase [Pirellulaceae bacterium]
MQLPWGSREGNVLQIDKNSYIDLQPPSVYCNHSCEPNVGVNDKREAIALRAIERGEELFFDYSTTMSENRWTMVCHCGRESCRGLVEDFHRLPPKTRKRYLSMRIVMPFIAVEHQEEASTGVHSRSGVRR